MTPIHFAWLTTILYTVSGIAGKLSSKYQIANPYLFNFLWMLLTFLFILPVTAFSGISWPGNWTSMLTLSSLNALSNLLFIICLYRLDISTLAPVYSLRTPVAVILGVLLFGEILTPVQIALITAIFTASLFVGIDEKTDIRAFISRDMGLIIVNMLASALFNVAIRYASSGNSFIEITFWSNFLGLIFTLPTLPLFLPDLKKTGMKHASGAAVSTLLATIALLSSYKALGDNVSISIAIMALPLSMILAIALSIFRPQLLEKHPPKIYIIRLTAATVMTVCAIFLSL